MKKTTSTFRCWYITFWVIVFSIIAVAASYDIGYRDGQINAINGQIDYEIVYDSTYILKDK